MGPRAFVGIPRGGGGRARERAPVQRLCLAPRAVSLHGRRLAELAGERFRRGDVDAGAEVLPRRAEHHDAHVLVLVHPPHRPRDLIPHGGVDGVGLPRTVQTDDAHVRRAIHLEDDRLEARRLDRHRRDGTFARSSVCVRAPRGSEAPHGPGADFGYDDRGGRSARPPSSAGDVPRRSPPVKCGPPTSARRTPPTRAHPSSRTPDTSNALLERISRPPPPSRAASRRPPRLSPRTTTGRISRAER